MTSFRKIVERIEAGKTAPKKSVPTMAQRVKESQKLVGRRIDHPINGRGKIERVTESGVEVKWTNLKLAISERVIPLSDLRYVVIEKYTKNPDDVTVGKKNKKVPVKKADEKKLKKEEAKESATSWMLSAYDLGLTEEDNSGGPEYILANAEEMHPEENDPLSTLGGTDEKMPEPYEIDSDPEDAPDVPKYLELGDPGEGNRRSTSRPSGGEKSSSESSSGDEKKGGFDFRKKAEERAEKSSGSETSGSESSTDSSEKKKESVEESKKMRNYKTLVEGISFDDYDLDGAMITECGMEQSDGPVREHNMAAGEIAMTQDLLKTLLSNVIEQGVDVSLVPDIVAAISACCDGEDRTLGVEDIDTIMGKMREIHGGSENANAGVEPDGDEGAGMEEPAAPMGDHTEPDGDEGAEGTEPEFEDKAEGDGEPAGPEGGEEHEGKTKLMSGQRASMKESKKTASAKPKLNEMWLAAIGGTLRNPETPVQIGDEDEIETIKRRAGVGDWWKK